MNRNPGAASVTVTKSVSKSLERQDEVKKWINKTKKELFGMDLNLESSLLYELFVLLLYSGESREASVFLKY